MHLHALTSAAASDSGALVAPNDDDDAARRHPARSSPASAHHRRNNLCLVDDCTALRFVPERGRRLTLACAAHRGAMSVMYEGVPSRECQACRTFHPVEEFHKDNKTCSWRLSRKKLRYRIEADDARLKVGYVPKKRGRPPASSREPHARGVDPDATAGGEGGGGTEEGLRRPSRDDDAAAPAAARAEEEAWAPHERVQAAGGGGDRGGGGRARGTRSRGARAGAEDAGHRGAVADERRGDGVRRRRRGEGGGGGAGAII